MIDRSATASGEGGGGSRDQSCAQLSRPYEISPYRVNEQLRGKGSVRASAPLSMVAVRRLATRCQGPRGRALLKLNRERSARRTPSPREHGREGLKLSGQVEGRPLPESGEVEVAATTSRPSAFLGETLSAGDPAMRNTVPRSVRRLPVFRRRCRSPRAPSSLLRSARTRSFLRALS